MFVNALFLADTAEMRDDRLEVSGGAWDQLRAAAWPAAHSFQVIALLAPAESEVGQELETSVRVIAPDGSAVGGIDATIVLAAHREQAPVVMPLVAEFEGPGTYTLAVLIGEAERSITFDVDGPGPEVRVQQVEQGLN